MTRTLTLIAFAAAGLAACEPTTIEGGGPADPMANEIANAAPVTLPPSIVASHPYRCKDNSLIRIEWLSDGTTNSARVTPDGGTTVSLTQAEANGPYTADGASLTGTSDATSITYNGQSCRR